MYSIKQYKYTSRKVTSRHVAFEGLVPACRTYGITTSHLIGMHVQVAFLD